MDPYWYFSTLFLVFAWEGATAQSGSGIHAPPSPQFSQFRPMEFGTATFGGPSMPQQPAANGSGQAVTPRPTDRAAVDRIVDLGAGDRRSTACTSAPHAYGGIWFADTTNPDVSERSTAYIAAENGLTDMLIGRQPIDLRHAVYAAEGPIIGSLVSYEQFEAMVLALADLVKAHLKDQRLDPQNPVQVHLGIQELFRDTFTDPLTGKRWRPLRYDLDDFFGDQDPAKITVSKLLLTGEGQCRSMPLLYLVLAEALHVEAFLAFSPNHSYVKYRDAGGTWHNFETTNGHEASDAWIAGSGYVHTEAIRSHAYMDTVGTRRIVGHLLGELAVNYRFQFGFNPAFMEPCLEQALKVYPEDIHSRMELANLRLAEFERDAYAAGYPKEATLATHYPKLAAELRRTRELYGQVDHMGFAEMPPEAYAQWQRSLDAERERRASEAPAPITPLHRVKQ